MKKKFMGAFALIASSFVAQQATANTVSLPESTPLQDISTATTGVVASDLIKTKSDSGDIFNFVLKRSGETGQLMAYHESHASHASHASHYSSR